MARKPPIPTGEKAPPQYTAPLFVPTDPNEQQRFLGSQFSAIADALKALQTAVSAAPRTTALQATGGPITAHEGDTIRVSPKGSTSVVLLPTARAANKGDEVAILVESPGTVIVRAVDSLVQNAGQVTLTGIGLRVMRSDGGNGQTPGGWWIVGENSGATSSTPGPQGPPGSDGVDGAEGQPGPPGTSPSLAGLVFIKRTILRSGTTLAVDIGTRVVRAQGVGGGGSGAGANAAAGAASVSSGGGAAAYGDILFNVIGGDTLAYTIGLGGPSALGAGGSPGTDTTLTYAPSGVACSAGGGAAGGLGGSGTSVLGAGSTDGGTASGWDINADGAPATVGLRSSGTVGQAGAGGPSFFGQGGVGGRSIASVSQDGEDGQDGAGGGGAVNFNDSPAAGNTGGKGGDGLLIIEEYGSATLNLTPGVRGIQGLLGPPGSDGVDGQDGIPGVQGIPGAAGTNGAVGPQGPPGFDGKDGEDGLDGVPGIPGPQGLNGTNGTVGPQGPPGTDGLDGADGQDGPPGLPGAQGIPGVGTVGPQGPPGSDGADGADGLDGIPGLNGGPGATGATGATGSAGFTIPANDGESGADTQVIMLPGTPVLPLLSITEAAAGPFNDYAIPSLANTDFILVASAATQIFTGFACAGGNQEGYRFKLLTGSSASGSLTHNSASSLAANRIFNGGNVNLDRRARDLLELEYFTSGWRVMNHTGTAIQSNATAERVSTEGGSVAVASSAGMLITAETGTRYASSPISGKSGLIEIVPGATISTPAANITALSAGSAVQEPLLVGTSAIRERVGYSITDGRTANLAQTAAITNITISTVAINANGWVAAATQPTAFLLSGRFLFNHAGGAATPTITIEALINAAVQATVVMTPVTATAAFGGEVQAVFTCRAIGATASAFVNIACKNNFGSALIDSYATSNNSIVAGTFDSTAASSVTLRIRMTTAVASNVLTVTEGFGGRIS